LDLLFLWFLLFFALHNNKWRVLPSEYLQNLFILENV
jgi:hypothetical protein